MVYQIILQIKTVLFLFSTYVVSSINRVSLIIFYIIIVVYIDNETYEAYAILYKKKACDKTVEVKDLVVEKKSDN